MFPCLKSISSLLCRLTTYLGQYVKVGLEISCISTESEEQNLNVKYVSGRQALYPWKARLGFDNIRYSLKMAMWNGTRHLTGRMAYMQSILQSFKTFPKS